MNPGGASRIISDDHQILGPRDATDRSQQLAPLARRPLVVKNQHSASGREFSHEARPALAKPCVHNQPIARHLALAVSHRPSYSAAMTAAQRLQSVRVNI